MNPAESQDHFGHDEIYSGNDGWNVKSNRFSCSFQLGDRMFIVGGEGSYGYDSYELVYGPPQWTAKVGSEISFADWSKFRFFPESLLVGKASKSSNQIRRRKLSCIHVFKCINLFIKILRRHKQCWKRMLSYQ